MQNTRYGIRATKYEIERSINMSKTFNILFLVVALTVGSFYPVFAQVGNGKAAPNFTLKDSNGNDVSLSQFQGKYVVMEWLNYDCPFVKKHYGSGNIQNLQKIYTGKDVTWLSIISSAPEQQGYYEAADVNRFNEEKKASPTAILLDPAGTVGKLYGAQTTPHMFVIDSKGILVYQGAIDDIRSTNPDDVARARNYVSAALDEVMAGKPVSVPSTKSYGCSVKYQQ